MKEINKNQKQIGSVESKPDHSKPNLDIKKIGIVSREYNNIRDFNGLFVDILKELDNEGCDTILFSLYSIIPKEMDVCSALNKIKLKNIKYVLIEEFEDNGDDKRIAGRYVVYYIDNSIWKNYYFNQIFGSLSNISKDVLDDFVANEMPKRILGNCCILLCGETNGVKYEKTTKQVKDTFGLRNSIPENVNVILNPIHDRMTRFEMKLKRQFLSENNRLVISVWNKGRKDKNDNIKDGKNPAWTVFYNNNEITINAITKFKSNFDLEVGIIDLQQIHTIDRNQTNTEVH